MSNRKAVHSHKKVWAAVLIGLLLTILFSFLLFIKFTPFEILEGKLYDYRFRARGQLKHQDNIIIAAIDEKSIEKLGRWPWSRDRITELLKKLTEGGAEIIAFDIIFSEKEVNDPALGKAIREAGNVILPIAFDLGKNTKPVRQENESLLNSAYRTVANPERFNKYNPVMASGVLRPVDELIKNSASIGHINMLADSDGTLRWEFLAIEYDGYVYPSIDLQVAALYLGISPENITLKAAEGIQLGKKRYLPTEKQGQLLINYYGPSGTFRRISISDIIDNTVKPEQLQGKIILVGATDAKGVFDLRVTPFTAELPGVEKHASVIASIIENRLLTVTPLHINIAILIFSGIIFTLIITKFKAFWATLVAILFLLLMLLAGFYLFTYKDIWVNIAYPALNILSIFITITAYQYTVEEKYAKKIRAMFSNYVTERLVNEMVKNPELAKLGGERREVTVLFSDVRSFTNFSEKHTPEEVVAILNEYLGAMTQVIFKWEGVLDKFIGDAIVAFWGAPMPQENHSELAVRCALNMVKRIEELQTKWKAEGKDPLDMGIGINTGEVIVGNIGAEGMKMDYTVIGDHVNLGARIESLTRKYDTHILTTEFTIKHIRKLIEDGKLWHISAKGLEKVIVKGKEEPVSIYEIKALAAGSESVITDPEPDKVVKFKEK